MLCFPRSSTGVRAFAAQKQPVNTICSQCGSVLASGVHVCNFCEMEDAVPLENDPPAGADRPPSNSSQREWRGELDQRLQAYRVRRRRTVPDKRQSALPFDENPPEQRTRVIVQEAAIGTHSRGDDFAFTIAIGRIAKQDTDPQVLIDVSNPPNPEPAQSGALPQHLPPPSNVTLPVASLESRRRALVIDAVCLAFAYGSFLALFGSLGGHFTLSKLSAAVCAFTFAFVYVQYFGLFSVFGGNTPGMMLSGLQVASVTGDLPTPRQYLLRGLGYMLSAGSCFLGFLWAYWDEEGLTWHDRISETYLTAVEPLLGEDVSAAGHAR
jgi:uncharacterized RDD family membrane protein YckC